MDGDLLSTFVGRDGELARLRSRLEAARSSGTGAMVALRGRRRVGKSRLVEEFARQAGVPYVFYTAVQGTSESELARFAEAIAESDAPSAAAVRAGAVPTTWEGALELAAQGATRDRPVIIVIDELPYLIERDPSIEAVLQKVWDRALERAPVVVILIGSDEAMMAALSAQGRPLYDRAREMVVLPLTIADLGRLLGLAGADAFDAYAVIGGFPVLALEWGTGRSRADYLADALNDPTSFLVVSAERALAAEFPAHAQARAVLSTIGHGVRAHSKIQSTSGLAGSALERALESLSAKGVVERLTPYSTRAASSSPHYVVADPYLRFWLRFINDKLDRIERGRGQLLVDEVERGWSAFRGRAIEPLVRASLVRLLPDSERFGSAEFVGSFWNRPGTVEVDLVGGDRDGVARVVSFVGSIKWRESGAFDSHDADALSGNRASVPGAHGARLVGVSRAGFEPDVRLDVRVTPEELVGAWD